MKSLISPVLFLLILIQHATAQDFSIKFGKVSEEELLMKTCPVDSTAGAMVLGDYGKSYFIYDQAREMFVINFERHVRIKILKKSGYNAAEEVIPYYRNKSTKEEVNNLKGYTYNLEDGKIVKTKLEKDGIFDEVVNEHWTYKKIAMPNIKEGSVIELTYVIRSPFYYNLKEWEFQRDIPVLYSEYSVKLPEYFEYKILSQGYEPFVINKSSTGQGDIVISTKRIVFRTSDNIWAVKNVPAITEEPYMTTIQDYVTKIEFELSSTKFPGSIWKNYSKDWESITEELLTHDKFGKQLEKSAFIKQEVAKIAPSAASDEEKAKAVYGFVKNNIKWNDQNRLFTSQNLKKSFEEKTGNSSDINLLLILMLREAGLDAEPLILSTRDHGRANLNWPLATKFNYVVAHIIIGGKSHILDATDPFLPFGMVPYKCLNGQGKVISKKRLATIDLGTNERHSEFYSATIDLDNSGMLQGTIQYSRGSLNASTGRRKIVGLGQEKYIEDFVSKHSELEIEDFKILNLEAIDESLKEEFKISYKDFSGASTSILYIDPLLFTATKENPFKLAQRKFPVDFACPIDETIIIKYNLPAGYVVEEKPENLILSMPNNTGKFLFNVAESNNTLQFTSRITINSRFFGQENYEMLREFFSQVVEKHTQQLVLKKI